MVLFFTLLKFIDFSFAFIAQQNGVRIRAPVR